MSPDSLNISGELIAELAEVRAQLHSVIGAMPIVLWAVDAAGTITLSEGQALGVLGLTPGQLVGLSVHDVYADAPEAIDAIARALRGEANAADVQAGGRMWSNRYFPRVDPDGNIVGLTGLSIDVTESKQLELEAKRLEEQVRHAQKLESLGLLAGGIAHDFNNLLAAILGNFNLLGREVPADSRAKLLVREGERAALRAAELTHQMLVYAGRGHFRVGPADLNSLILDMASLIASGLSKRAAVSYDLAGDLPPVTVDSAQIQQVVMNLLTNASDALGGEAGEIHVLSGRTTDSHFQTSERHGNNPTGDAVFFEVRDTGEGMDEATQRRIFEPFFSTKQTGRGLGLSAVMGIVRGHGGTLEVQSTRGEGTRFRVTLPVDATASPTITPEPVANVQVRVPVSRAGRVLLVDDEDMVRSVVREALTNAGFEVVAYASSTIAAEHVRTHANTYSAAVIDVVMPGMTGNDLVRLIRQHAPQLPVVMMSGLDADAADAVAETPGQTVFIQKPFVLGALITELLKLRNGGP